MPDSAFPVEMVQGVPVVAAPAEIDITNVEKLRSANVRFPAAYRRGGLVGLALAPVRGV
jgi:hypothetical protein